MSEENRIVCVKLMQSLGEGLPEGEILHLAEDKADALVKAGLAEHASEEDMSGDAGEEEQMDVDNSEPLIANSVEKLNETIQKSISEGVSKVVEKMKSNKTSFPTVAAEVKEPLYRNNGQYIKDIIKADIFGDKTAKNKVMAFQEVIAKNWEALGIIEKAPLGINEGTNSQGGYLVNPQFSPDVFAVPHTQINLVEEAGRQINAESLTYNQRFVNETSLANGSIFGGLNVVATAEGATFTSSLPAWSNITLTLSKFGLFVYYTEEILQDASYPVESELNEYAEKAFLYGLNTQVIQGGTLEGILNTPALVTVTSSTNDTAYHTAPATCLTYADLAAMDAAFYPDCKASPKAMWLYHPSLKSALNQMTYTFSGSSPAWGLQYDAQRGLDGTRNGPTASMNLLGYPAYPSFACSAPGVAGDILLVDMAQVATYKKPFRVEVSKEFQFGTDQVAVRYVSRLDSKAIWRNKITGVNGTQQFSAFITRSAVGT